MPANLLDADIGFPDTEGNASTEEKLKSITNYLYMLLEQLRYTLSNLGKENFNESELESIAKIITDPVLVKLSDTEKGFESKLSVTADGIRSEISGVNGRVTTIETTVGGISSTVSDINTGQTNINQTVKGISSTVNNLNDEFAIVQQTVNGITVTTQDKTTYIDGNKIKTGEISGINFNCNFNDGVGENGAVYFCLNGYPVAKIGVDNNGAGTAVSSEYRIFFTSFSQYIPIKLVSSGDMSIEAGGKIYIAGGTGSVQINAGNIKLYGNVTVNDKTVKTE